LTAAAKHVADLARAAKVYAQRQRLGEEAIQKANAVVVDAMALMGEFLKETPKNEGGRPTKTCSTWEQVFDPPSYTDLGIDRKEAADAQALAEAKQTMPEDARPRGYRLPG
jgi:hypothetical protein